MLNFPFAQPFFSTKVITVTRRGLLGPTCQPAVTRGGEKSIAAPAAVCYCVVHVHVGLDTVAGQSTRHSALDPTQLQALGCEKSLVGLRWIDPPRLGPFLG